MKIFYDHLIIELDSVYAEIEKLTIKHKQKQEFINLVDETTHHQVLGTILESLDKQYHPTFLKKFHASPHDPSHLEFLKDKVEDIEEKIKATVKNLKLKLLTDLTDHSHQ